MSGRAIRKLPFLAHAYFVQQAVCTLDVFLTALDRAVSQEQASVHALSLRPK